jgi:hypothetical protein
VLGTAVELASRLVGARPPLAWSELQSIIERWGYFDGSKAERELEVRPRHASEIIPDTLFWLLERGELRPEIADAVRAARDARIGCEAPERGASVR